MQKADPGLELWVGQEMGVQREQAQGNAQLPHNVRKLKEGELRNPNILLATNSTEAMSGPAIARTWDPCPQVQTPKTTKRNISPGEGTGTGGDGAGKCM